MSVGERDIEDYLVCPTKSWLRATGLSPTDPELAEYRNRIVIRFRPAQRAVLETKWQTAPFPVGVPRSEAFRRTGADILYDCPIVAGQIQTIVHGIGRPSPARKATSHYEVPIRLLSRPKVTDEDRVLLAFDALAVQTETGKTPPFGWLVYGLIPVCRKVPITTTMLGAAKAVLDKVTALRAGAEDVAPVIEKRCSDCEFRTHCRGLAEKSDDLALILGMSAKERKSLHDKGIFTVNQFSYTFRLRRSRKNPDSVYGKRHHALTALAMREQKIYVLGEPRIDLGKGPVYLDVEGVPDLSFYYLIGASCFRDGKLTHAVFWADDPADERLIWKNFLAFLSRIDGPTIVHYGGYERQFLRDMSQRYSEDMPDQAFVGRLTETSCNVLSTVFSHIYFPAYSNGLKDIAGFLGFRWTDPRISEALASVRRLRWEQTRDPEIKRGLIEYNADDCRALVELSKMVSAIAARTPQPGVVPVSTTTTAQTFYRKGFVIPEFKEINDAAYWDRQRDMIYVRSSQHYHGKRQRERERAMKMKPNRTLTATSPSSCSTCGCTQLRRGSSHTRVLYDIKFTGRGMRRDVVKYKSKVLHCDDCGERITVRPDPWPVRKYGQGFLAYIVYNLVELCLLLRPTVRHLNDSLGFTLGEGVAGYARSLAARDYYGTYERIKQDIVRSHVTYVDETNAELRNGTKGYVWVIATDNEVFFFFTKNRESDRVKEILSGFTGVLVTDFYAGYDAIACPQQKCLIHLMRNLNDDVLKQPFNEELKGLGAKFGSLLRPIIATIDSCGLTHSALKAHLPHVDGFYGWVDGWKPASEVCVKYQARFQGNRDRLFTFLKHDGVSWNNNNAEHAIKEFGRLRDAIDGLNDEEGLGEYLVLLSISVTCKYREVSPLRFLQSGERDIDVFCAGWRGTTRRKG